MKLLSKSTIFTLLIVSSFIASSTLSAKAENPNSVPEKTPASSHINVTPDVADVELQVNNLLAFARRFRGVPYRYGGTSPKGFDCSGFTSYVFRNMGYSIPRTGRAQFADGERVERSQLKPGDLVFFAGRGGGPSIGHVGIVTAVDGNGHDFSFIHASCSRGITESHSTESYYRVRYRNACRIIKPSPAAAVATELTAESEQLLQFKTDDEYQPEKPKSNVAEKL